MARFPQFHLSPDTEGLFKAEAGLVDAALANSVHIQLAKAHGAEIIEHCTVTRLEPLNRDHCVVNELVYEFTLKYEHVSLPIWSIYNWRGPMARSS